LKISALPSWTIAAIVVYTGESRRSGSLILPLAYDHAGLPGIW